MKETDISKTIIEEYSKRLLESLENEVIIVGAGPAGLTAAYYLTKSKIKTLVLEKRLSIGGGIWGGAAGRNVIVFEDNDILNELGIKTKKIRDLYVVDAIEFATALGYRTKIKGAEILNLTEAEDIIVKKDSEGKDSVEGIVVNSTPIKMANLHVDPFCISSRYIVDATGHQAEIVNMLRKKIKSFSFKELGEGFMDVEKAEEMVVEKTGEVYPRVYVAGMSVCSAYNLPRMGPIFGGMLKSGKKVAEMIKNRKMKEQK